MNQANSVSRPGRIGTRLLLTTCGALVGIFGDFEPLRRVHVVSIIEALNFLTVSTERLSTYLIMVGDTQITIGSQCTSLFAALGLVPLLWRSNWNYRQGVIKVLAFFLIFEVLNILRITIGLYFFANGHSWNATHAIPSAIFYAVLLYWALHHGGFVRLISSRNDQQYR